MIIETSEGVFQHFKLWLEKQNFAVLNVCRLAYSLNKVEVNRELRRFQYKERVPFGAKSSPRTAFVTQLKCYTGSIIPCGGLSSLNAQAFCSYLRYFAEAIVEA